MISPVSLPTINEEPRIATEVRPFFIYTSISDDFVTGGGHYAVAAVQARLAITDRLAFIASKDGYIWLRPDHVVADDEGFANISFGLKGAVIRDEESALIASVGLRYDAPWGNRDVLQGRGDGALNPFLTVAKGFGDLHVQGYTGPRLAIADADSSFYDLSLHCDYRLGIFYPLVEFNWVHVIEGGRRLPIDQEGFDLVTLGATEAGGESVATLALGARVRLIEGVDLGLAGEFPLTERSDIIGWRITSDVALRFP